MSDQLPNYRTLVQDGDMVLCRTNAPLVSQCFRFLREGRRAVIRGRDVEAGLVKLVRKLAKDDPIPVVGLIQRLSDWLHTETAKEQAKRNPDEAKIDRMTDQHDCLVCFCDGIESVEGVVRKIEAIFTDNASPGITLSSIHRAKGLEAFRVFYLKPKGTGPRLDKMQGWELEQEKNLEYVAVTRAINELIFVS